MKACASAPADDNAAALHAARTAFLARFARFCTESGWKAGRTSRALFGAPDRITEIRGGSDIGVLRLARAEADLADLAAQRGIDLAQAVDNQESESVLEDARAARREIRDAIAALAGLDTALSKRIEGGG